jgi:FKBP-type peptidyl-prolyl cis-trans isomerase FkpA
MFAATASAQTMQKSPNGTQYFLFTHNTGDRIKVNDVISMYITLKTDKDSVLSSGPMQVQVKPSENVTDMMDVFPLMAVGDSVLIRVPADSVYKDHEDKRPPIFPHGSNFNFYIKMQKTETLDQAIAERNAALEKLKVAEKSNIEKYIADNKLIVKTTPSGLKYVITKVGLKAKPLPGDTVQVNYVGKFLTGQVFDTSIQSVAQTAGMNEPGRTFEPLRFAVGHQEVIPGWDEGLQLLPEGSKAILIVPSSLAYGEQGGPDGAIPPFTPLVFNVELVGVKRIKHAPAASKTTPKKHTPIKKKTS